MILGLDTGFFVKLLDGNAKAIEIWQGIIEGGDCVISCLTLFELRRLCLKGMLHADSLDTLANAIMSICGIVWLDNSDIHDLAARISYGTGIPAIDALIVACFVRSKVEKIYTTDKHLKLYQNKNIEIVVL